MTKTVSFPIQHSMLDVRCSMFDVRCSFAMVFCPLFSILDALHHALCTMLSALRCFNPATRASYPATRNPDHAPLHLTLTIFGSRVSRNPSPNKLKPNTAQAMAKPGKIAIQGDSDIKVWASFSMRPQEAWGGWVPKPR